MAITTAQSLAVTYIYQNSFDDSKVHSAERDIPGVQDSEVFIKFVDCIKTSAFSDKDMQLMTGL